MIKVYTDGSCQNNGKKNSKAGMGIYFGENDPRNVSEPLKGGKQTNNIAELKAILKVHSLLQEEIKNREQITIYSDSIYAIRATTEYGEKCEKQYWPRDVPNIDLVRKVYLLYKNKKNVQFVYIKAHTKNKDEHSLGNRMADYLAKKSIKF